MAKTNLGRDTYTIRGDIDVRAPLAAPTIEIPTELHRAGQGMPRGVDILDLAARLELPMPSVVEDALNTANKIVGNVRAAQQLATPVSLEEFAGPDAVRLIRQMALDTVVARPPVTVGLMGGRSALSEACNVATDAARQHVTAAVTEAAPEIFTAASNQWAELHKVIRDAELPAPADGKIDPASLTPEQLAALHTSAHIASRAGAVRELRDTLARLAGERPMQTDQWACYYSVPSDAAAAVRIVETLWDKRSGVSDDAAPWRAVAAGAVASLCVESEAHKRVLALSGERNRRAAEAVRADRERHGMLGVGDDRQSWRVIAEAEKQRRAAVE